MALRSTPTATARPDRAQVGAAQPGAARAENRRAALLEAAARHFLRSGYAAASMRDIAADAGMQVGSIYYHFPSKVELLAAVHEEGLRRIHEAVEGVLACTEGPWERLEAACEAHMTVLLDGGDFFQAVMREMPRSGDPILSRLIALRDAYEAIFTELLEAVPLPAHVNRHELRLMLLGAMNWSYTWYRPGAQAPDVIARHFLHCLRHGLAPHPPRTGDGS